MVDYEFGCTDKQLRNELMIAISTGISFFEFLEERFPGAVEAAEAYREGQQTAVAQ